MPLTNRQPPSLPQSSSFLGYEMGLLNTNNEPPVDINQAQSANQNMVTPLKIDVNNVIIHNYNPMLEREKICYRFLGQFLDPLPQQLIPTDNPDTTTLYNRLSSQLLPYWRTRRAGAAKKLREYLNKCFNEYRILRIERKKKEVKLSLRYTPMQRLSMHSSSVDRLIAVMMREHRLVTEFISKTKFVQRNNRLNNIEEYMGEWLEAIKRMQACRWQEILTHIRLGDERFNHQAYPQRTIDIAALASSIEDLSNVTRMTRQWLFTAFSF